jgi:hypothetical protein
MAGEWPVSYKASAKSETFDHCIYCGNAVPRATTLLRAHTHPSPYTRPTGLPAYRPKTPPPGVHHRRLLCMDVRHDE